MYIRILECPVNLCYSECLKYKVLIVLDFPIFGMLDLWTAIYICHFIALELIEEDIYTFFGFFAKSKGSLYLEDRAHIWKPAQRILNMSTVYK